MIVASKDAMLKDLFMLHQVLHMEIQIFQKEDKIGNPLALAVQTY